VIADRHCVPRGYGNQPLVEKAVKVYPETKTVLRMIAPLIDVGLDVSGFEQLRHPL
jgi:hypothetical protein